MNSVPQKLSAEELMLQRVVHANPVAISITVLDTGKLTDVNPRFEELSGYSRSELLSSSTLMLNIWVNPDQRASIVDRIRKGEVVRDMEIGFRPKSGTTGYALISAQMLEIDGEQRMLAYTYDITGRKQLEEQVRQSEELFSKAFHASPAWMVLVRLSDMTILDINTAALERFGYTRDEMVGRKSFETQAWISEEARTYIVTKVLKGESIYNYVIPYRTKEGNIRRQLASIQCITVRGEPCTLTVAVDITERLELEEQLETHVQQRTAELAQANALLRKEIGERKEAESAARKSELQYRSLFEQASDGIVLLDERGAILDVNTAICDMLGVTRKEAVGKYVTDFIDQENLAGQPLRLNILSGLGKPFINERRLRHKDGWLIEVEISTKQLPDGRIQGIVRDIGERKKNEHEQLTILRDLSNALREAEKAKDELLQTFERLTDGFAAFDNDMRFTYLNHRGAEMLNRTQETIIGKRFPDEFPQVANLPSYHDFLSALANRKPFTLEVFGPLTHSWYESRIYPSESGISLFFKDITEHKRSEAIGKESRDQLRELANRLQSIREEERKVISREIHAELDQALTGLKIDLSWMESRLSTNDQIVHERALSMLDRIDRIIIAVQRISTELRPGMLDDLGLAAAIEWDASEFERRSGISCVIAHLDEDPTLAEPHATAFFRIFQETLANVARHSGATTVTIRLTAEDNQIKLEVTDNGRGIRQEEITNKKSIGLLGMKERALAIDGEFTIVGTEGQGTTVNVTMPTSAVTLKKL